MIEEQMDDDVEWGGGRRGQPCLPCMEMKQAKREEESQGKRAQQCPSSYCQPRCSDLSAPFLGMVQTVRRRTVIATDSFAKSSWVPLCQCSFGKEECSSTQLCPDELGAVQLVIDVSSCWPHYTQTSEGKHGVLLSPSVEWLGEGSSPPCALQPS